MIDSPMTVSALSAHKPIILIVTDNPSLSADIVTELERRGFNTRLSIFDGRMLKDTPRQPPKAVLVCFQHHSQAAPQVLSILRKRYEPHELSFIGTFPREADVDADLFDTVIFPPAHPAQIAQRVTSIFRLQKMEREISLRIETLEEDFGIEHYFSEAALENPIRVLFIGKASPEFLITINALENKDIDVVAAFTSYSAFSFLQETPFDAIILNMKTDPDLAVNICSIIRRNSRLYHTPAVFLTSKDFSDHTGVYAKGATDIISADAEISEISSRVLEVAHYYRIHQRLKSEFSALGGERCMNGDSGAYNTRFLRAHLRRILKADRQNQDPTSLLTLRLDPLASDIDAKSLQNALNQAGHMIKGMVRMEDVVARLSDNSYAIAFPGQSIHMLRSAAERIQDVVKTTEFPSKKQSFQFNVESCFSSAMTTETSAEFIERLQTQINKANPDYQQTA